jgi:hypothetical protein
VSNLTAYLLLVSQRSSVVIIRVPRSSYLLVGFLVVGFAPIALYGGAEHPTSARISGLTLLYLIPILVAFFIARNATAVGTDGILVRALFGRRMLAWDNIRGLSVSRRSVYAVLAELTSGRLHAFLDVFETEPLPAGHPLWSAPNVVITPHIGGGTDGWQDGATRFVFEQVERYLRGEELLNLVSPGEGY